MCAKYLVSLIAFWIFSLVGWITFPSSTPLLIAVFLISVVVFLLDMVLQMAGGVLGLFIGAVITSDRDVSFIIAFVMMGLAKYFSLALAAKLTGLFTMPWLFGPQWFAALIITAVFMAIMYFVGNKE